MTKRTHAHRLACLRSISEGRAALIRRGYRDADIRIAYCLFADERTWSISALSDATGLSRQTVRAHVAQWVERGCAARTVDGVMLTQDGVERTAALVDDFLAENAQTLGGLCRALRTKP